MHGYDCCEFDGLALQPGTGVLESLDAAGFDRDVAQGCPHSPADPGDDRWCPDAGAV